MRPASSRISASMIPGLSLKSAIAAAPLITASTASLLQCGHSESVLLGTPAAICILSQLLRSGPGAQAGRGDCPLGKIALTFLANDHAAFDADWAKLARWADIGQNLLWGFIRRRDHDKLRQHGEPAEKWLLYSTLESTRARGICCFATVFGFIQEPNAGYCYSLNLVSKFADDYTNDSAAASAHADDRSVGFCD